MCRVERDRASDVFDLISDAVYALDESPSTAFFLSCLGCFSRSRHLFFSWSLELPIAVIRRKNRSFQRLFRALSCSTIHPCAIIRGYLPSVLTCPRLSDSVIACNSSRTELRRRQRPFSDRNSRFVPSH